MKTAKIPKAQVLEIVRRAITIKKGFLYSGNWGKSIRLRHGSRESSKTMTIIGSEFSHLQGQKCFIIIAPVDPQIKKPQPFEGPGLCVED